MQLILEPESTVDLKTTMSLGDDSIDKSVSDILTARKGGISNGDIIAEKNEDAKDIENSHVEKTDQTKDNEPKQIDSNNDTEHDGETTVDDADIDATKDCITTDILNGNNESNKDSIENLLDKMNDENEQTEIETNIKENDPVDDNNSNEAKPNCGDKANSPKTDESAVSITEPADSATAIKTNIESCLDEDINENSNSCQIESIEQENLNNVHSVSENSSNLNSENASNGQENDEAAISDVINTSLSEDSAIKKELEEISSHDDDARVNPTAEDPELAEPNDRDIKLKAEDVLVSEDKERMETDDTEIGTSNESVDLICFNAPDTNDDTLKEPMVNDSEMDELTTINTDENQKTNEVLSKDVDDKNTTSDTDAIDSVTANTTEITESNGQSVLPVENNILEVNTKSSDDVIVKLDEDRKNNAEPGNVEIEPTLTKPDDDEPILDNNDATETINVEKPLTEDEMSVDEIIDLDEPKESQDSKSIDKESKISINSPNKTVGDDSRPIAPVLKLSNTLDILSDDEEEQTAETSNTDTTDSKCINIEDDDDIMLIDDDTSGNESKIDPVKEQDEKQIESKPASPIDSVKVPEESKSIDKVEDVIDKDAVLNQEVPVSTAAPDISDKTEETKIETEIKKPLIPENFLKTCKKNLVDMTRDELEEFCILKIVESILDRSNLSEIKNKLKTITQNLEEYKKKAMMLQKQNRDLQVVFKSVQEDVKKASDAPIVPLKITRSVGMQVLMSDKPDKRRRPGMGIPNTPVNINNKQVRNAGATTPRPQKPATQPIPVPRLVPANTPTKSPQQQVNTAKVTSPLPNGVKSVSPVQKTEKRTHNRMQSVTVDLTDDEPPTKIVNRTGPMPPVRLVPSQNLLAAPRTPTVNSPRKVYIPISGPQGQNVRPGQTIMLKTVQNPGPRQRGGAPQMVRMPQSIRMTRPQGLRHPAPLPECMKQYQPPNWKALPPAPDLKLAKVENGIVISWKIEGYQEDSYEEIASYQLYAYQETTSPPNTALWKKIGDVKALPLPMACTLTQFMAGYKYYFAVRAVDIRSRLGPFSLPGSILLLNKM